MKRLLSRYFQSKLMPRYQVTASFEPFEINAMTITMHDEGFKSRYQLVRRAVLVYVGLENDGRKETNEKPTIRETDNGTSEPINDIDNEIE